MVRYVTELHVGVQDEDAVSRPPAGARSAVARVGGYRDQCGTRYRDTVIIAKYCNYPSFHFTCLFPDKFVSWHIANFSMDIIYIQHTERYKRVKYLWIKFKILICVCKIFVDL